MYTVFHITKNISRFHYFNISIVYIFYIVYSYILQNKPSKQIECFFLIMQNRRLFLIFLPFLLLLFYLAILNIPQA